MACWWSGSSELRPLVHLLLPLCLHWVAVEMIESVVVDITTAAVCPRKTTCSKVICISGIQRTVVGIFRMAVHPILGQLADDYGRKPLLLITVSTTIFPFALLVWDQSEEFVYAYYVLRTISYIISQGNIFCISRAYVVSYQANVEGSLRAAVMSRITRLFSASHVLGNLLARILPEKYIFVVSIVLLIFCPVYMQFFLAETVIWDPGRNQESGFCTKIIVVLNDRFKSIKEAAEIVHDCPTLRRMALVSFFYKLGMSGISGILLYYLKAVFGFDKNQFSEMNLMVGTVSQILWLLLGNPLVGEKIILCFALLGSIAYGFLYGLAWAPWVPYLTASFRVIDVLVKHSTHAIVSKASCSDNREKVKDFIVVVQSISNLLSPLAMSPLTSWFLSSNPPFNCKGFSIICASLCMIISFCLACLLKPEACSAKDKTAGNLESPLLSNEEEVFECADISILEEW